MGFNWTTAIVCLGWEERTDCIYSAAKELIVLNCLFYGHWNAQWWNKAYI